MDALSRAARALAGKPSLAEPASAAGPAVSSSAMAQQRLAGISPTKRAASGGLESSQPEPPACSVSDHSAATQIIGHISEHSSPHNGPLAWPCVLPALPALDLRLPSSVPALSRTDITPASPAVASPDPESTPSPVESDSSQKQQRLTGARAGRVRRTHTTVV